MSVPAEVQLVRSQPTDPIRFGHLVEPLLPEAFDLAFAMLGDRQEAEDAVQEATLNAYRMLGQFTDRGAGLRPWYFKIVANQCRSLRRGRWTRILIQADVLEPTGASHESATILRLDLGRALYRLTPKERACLFLYYQLDLEQQEVARILGIRKGTVKSRVNRAMVKLRAALGDKEAM